MGIAQEGNGLPCNRRVDEANFCAVCNKTVKAGEGHDSESLGVLHKFHCTAQAAPRLNLRCRFEDASGLASRVTGPYGTKQPSLELWWSSK